jgi:rare lipoprotein A
MTNFISSRGRRKNVLSAALFCIAMTPMSSPDAHSQEIGIASVYGYIGELTASGEQLTMDGLTAAHPMLPFGSFVMVMNELNGRSVVVRINDRGPFVAGRIIDLTVPVAKALGLNGLGRVRVTPVKTKLPSAPLASRPMKRASE